MRLFVLGLGYSVRHFVRQHCGSFSHIAGTVRDPAKRDDLAGIEVHAFSGEPPARETVQQVRDADVLLVSVPPGSAGDPAIAAFGDVLAARRGKIVYLSTIGVYGDHGGAWVDEETPATPISGRSSARLAAEREWQALGSRAGKPVAILRLSGIYGPGQNALVQVARGTAKRIDKPGQLFNRIHVADIAQAIDAVYAQRAEGIFNITDDEPTAQGIPVAFAAELLGVAPPPEIPFDEAAKSMSPMARSFYAESKRVRNEKLKRALGVRLRYPTYREGLRALFADEQTVGRISEA
jgi:nucleoside-diphosphate-sugar epimerase